MFCDISTVDLSYVVPVKSTVEILQTFVVSWEYYMNFKRRLGVIQQLRGHNFAIFWPERGQKQTFLAVIVK